MWKLLTKLFEGEAKMKTEVMVEAVKAEMIGQPVIALAESISNTDDWDEEATDGPYYSPYVALYITLRHKVKALEVRISYTSKYERVSDIKREWVSTYKLVGADWMSGPEKEHVLNAYHALTKRKQEEAERARQRQLAAERQKFMVLVN